MFSHDAGVQDTTRAALDLAALYAVLDGFQCVGQGVLRGGGKQAIGAIVAVCCYYGLTLPMAYVLAYPCGLGLCGL